MLKASKLMQKLLRNFQVLSEIWGFNMVNFYVRRIKAGKMTIEEVPERWRSAVEEALGE